MNQQFYKPPEEGKMMYSTNYYTPTQHFSERYRQRMRKHVTSKVTKNRLLNVSDAELARRANFMLMFSIHGCTGATAHTEVRYYFEWDIVIDNKNKKIITMYINEDRRIPPVYVFGDRKLRRIIYNLWFRPNSKIRKQLTAV